MRYLTTFLLALTLSVTLCAQELSVRNKPYKGEIRGRGLQATVRLDEIAKALDLPTQQSEAGWLLGGQAIPTTDDGGATYVQLGDLAKAGLKVTFNKELNTIDVHRSVAKAGEGPAGASGLTLVYFGAKW